MQLISALSSGKVQQQQQQQQQQQPKFVPVTLFQAQSTIPSRQTAMVSLLLLCSVLSLFGKSHAAGASPNEWKWRPEDEHPCTVKRMTMEDFFEAFGSQGLPALYPDPLVLVGDRGRNEGLRRLTQEDTIASNFPSGFNVTLSSSNSFSQHRRTIPLELYLEEMQRNNGTTSPHQRSNESWYLFGETFTRPWKELLDPAYQLPPCHSCKKEYSALSFGIGNRGSGVQWHVHGPGFSEALHGRKHWVLYPSHYEPPYFHHDQSTRNWMEHIYTNTTRLLEYLHDKRRNSSSDNSESLYPILDNGRPYECNLEPGDLIYLPDRFHHATINCDPYTAFVSTFTSDHLYLQDTKQQKFKKTAAAPFGSEL